MTKDNGRQPRPGDLYIPDGARMQRPNGAPMPQLGDGVVHQPARVVVDAEAAKRIADAAVAADRERQENEARAAKETKRRIQDAVNSAVAAERARAPKGETRRQRNRRLRDEQRARELNAREIAARDEYARQGQIIALDAERIETAGRADRLAAMARGLKDAGDKDRADALDAEANAARLRASSLEARLSQTAAASTNADIRGRQFGQSNAVVRDPGVIDVAEVRAMRQPKKEQPRPGLVRRVLSAFKG